MNNVKHFNGTVSMVDGHLEGEKRSCEDCYSHPVCRPSMEATANKCERYEEVANTPISVIADKSICMAEDALVMVNRINRQILGLDDIEPKIAEPKSYRDSMIYQNEILARIYTALETLSQGLGI